MNEDAFNLSLRKFLKTFGVSAQREIEQAVRAAIEDGRATGNEPFQAIATIRIPAVGLDASVTGEIGG